jgi:hypothetical protein
MRESFEASMKGILVKSVVVCEKKCVQPSENEALSKFEMACLGKCFDKYYAIYEKNVQGISGALKLSKKESDYDQNF